MLELIIPYISDILSAIALAVTIYFSWGARSAAQAAQLASNQTRLRLGKIEASDLVRDCIFSAKSLIEKIEAGSWDLVSYNSSNIRRSLVSIKHAADNILQSDHLEAIDEAIIQFRILTDQADKARLTEWKGYKPTTYVSMVHVQVDALIAIQEHIRKKLGDEK